MIEPKVQFNVDFIEKTAQYEISRINGKVNDEQSRKVSLPFIGFDVKIKKAHFNFQLYHTEKPKKLNIIMKETRAFLGINGGFWDHQKKALDGLVFHKKIIKDFENPTRPVIFFEDNDISIGNYNDQMQFDHAIQSGPLLLQNSIPQFDYTDYQKNAEQFDSDITIDRHPRSVLGISQDFIHFLAINGRSLSSAGLYLEECAILAQKLGMTDAMNLDGGASSTLIVNGKRLNSPRFSFYRGARLFSAPIPGRERKIPNAILAFLI
jgi:exopolysaccharide biosynthesis protein